MSASDWRHVDVREIKAETAKALLLVLSNKREAWVPLSVISDPDDYQKGDKNCTISIREWFCDKEGIH